MDVKLVNESFAISKQDYVNKSVEKKVSTNIFKKDSANEKTTTKFDTKELNLAVDKANRVLFKNNTHLQFRVHEKTNEIMVKIVDDVSGEVLREIPPEKMLDLVAKLWEIAGIIVDEKA